MRRYRRLFTSFVLILGVLAVPVASASPEPQYERLRIMAEWSSDAERADFQQLLLPFFQQQSVTVDLVNATDLPGTLQREVAAGTPPDVVLMAHPALMVDYARAGALMPFDAAVGGPAAGYLPALADALAVDGTVYGRYVRLSVDGLAWYSPAALQAAGASPPGTWDEMLSFAATLSANGTPAWALGLASGDAGTDVIETLLARNAGADAVEALAQGALPWTDPQVRAAWEQFGALLDSGVVNDAVQLSPAEAAQAPFATPPLADLGLAPSAALRWITADTRLQPGQDVDFFALPGGNPSAVSISGDFIVLFSDSPLAVQLAQFLADPATAVAWAATGGAISPYAGGPYPNAVMERAASLIYTGDPVLDLSSRVPLPVQSAFVAGVLRYAQDRATLDEVLASIQAAAEAP